MGGAGCTSVWPLSPARGVGHAQGHNDLLDLVAEHLLHELGEGLELGLQLLELLLIVLTGSSHHIIRHKEVAHKVQGQADPIISGPLHRWTTRKDWPRLIVDVQALLGGALEPRSGVTRTRAPSMKTVLVSSVCSSSPKRCPNNTLRAGLLAVELLELLHGVLIDRVHHVDHLLLQWRRK